MLKTKECLPLTLETNKCSPLYLAFDFCSHCEKLEFIYFSIFIYTISLLLTTFANLPGSQSVTFVGCVECISATNSQMDSV